jgi:hypothetical protein
VIKEVPKVVTIKHRAAVIEARVQSIFEPQVIWMKESAVVHESSTKKVKHLAPVVYARIISFEICLFEGYVETIT